jgi:hypothetical protein
VRSITAIDHDLSFPTTGFDVTKKAKEYMGLPQHIDRQTSEMVMALEPQELREILKDLLTAEEIRCTVERLEALKLAITTMTHVDPGGWTKTTAQKEVTSETRGYVGDTRRRLGQKPPTG